MKNLFIPAVLSCGLFSTPRSTYCEWCILCFGGDENCAHEKLNNSQSVILRIGFEAETARFYEKRFTTDEECLIKESFFFGFPGREFYSWNWLLAMISQKSQTEQMKLNMSKSDSSLLLQFSEEVRNKNQETFVYANDITVAAMFELARSEFELYQVQSNSHFVKKSNFSQNERIKYLKSVLICEWSNRW